MSTLDTHPPVELVHGHGDNHDPHLAHHFDTVEQQFQSAKLGMWTFLGTEILMFGGLFCAYSVYRHNHPDVFAVAHEALNRYLGAVNTIVLITSSLTMAWGVRAAQLGNQAVLRWLLAATLFGGYGFLGIKAIEYHTKWQHKLGFGSSKVNSYYGWDGTKTVTGYFEEEAEHAEGAAANGGEATGQTTQSAPATPTSDTPVTELPPGAAIDPNVAGPDKAKIVANFADPPGVVAKYSSENAEAPMTLDALSQGDKKTVYTFFAVYFFMTGLHGLHVLIGMSLIYWILLRSAGARRRRWLIPAAPISLGLFFCYLGIIAGGAFWGTFMIAFGVVIALDGALWATIWGRVSTRARQLTYLLMPSAQLLIGAILTVLGFVNLWMHGLTFWGLFLLMSGGALTIIGAVWFLAWVRSDPSAANEGEFGPDYFTPVDLVGLYWHVVDLIWIFLFPMLYLIH